MEGYEQGGGGGRIGEKVQGIRSINGRYKRDRKRRQLPIQEFPLDCQPISQKKPYR